ncbi:MAG TPA: formylglycine-generating enzyme family protein [Planctomycetaceae bacterium]
MQGKKPGDVRDDNGLKMKFVWCPAGFFAMKNVELMAEPASEKEVKPNDDDEFDPKEESAPTPRQTIKVTPVKVFLTQGYWIGKYEVTQLEWSQEMESEPWKGHETAIAGHFAPPQEGVDFPATYVTWSDAMEFCAKLTVRERKAGRLREGWEYTLPTEAQWERACRARTDTKFCFGDDESKLGEYAWFAGNALKGGEPFAHRVGQKKSNPWGLHDMHGNAWEWCRDVWTVRLPGGRDPLVSIKEAIQDPTTYNWVYRGGGWDRNAEECGSAYRNGNHPSRRVNLMGFRVALSIIRQANPAAASAEARSATDK